MGGAQSSQPHRVCVSGAYSSGKTNLIMRLELVGDLTAELGADYNLISSSTIGTFTGEITHTGCTLGLTEVSGGNKIYPLWKQFTEHAELLIFLVDSTRSAAELNPGGHCLMSDSAQYLRYMLDITPGGARVPVLVLCNKQVRQHR